MQSCWYLMTRSRTVRKPSAVSKSSMPLPCSQAYTIEMAKSRSGKTVASKAENICCVAIQMVSWEAHWERHSDFGFARPHMSPQSPAEPWTIESTGSL
ncbi:hypothetical protein LEMLEM_LOCUS20334 [Lemmus lemmus]